MNKQQQSARDAAQFTKKPVTIWAIQLQDSDASIRAVESFLQGCPVTTESRISQEKFSEYCEMLHGQGGRIVHTLEGDHLARFGDWIIRGVKGEFYPCKPDIFALTYDAAKGESVTVKAEPPLCFHRNTTVREDNGMLDCNDCGGQEIDYQDVYEYLTQIGVVTVKAEPLPIAGGAEDATNPHLVTLGRDKNGAYIYARCEMCNGFMIHPEPEADPQQPDPAESTDADKGVCECGHIEDKSIWVDEYPPAPELRRCVICGQQGVSFTYPHGQGSKPAQQPEPSEFRYPDRRCTPPASEPPRDAVIAEARHWLETNTPIRWTTQKKADASDIEFDIPLSELNRRPQQYAERLADFAIQFAGQRAEVAHEHNALCTIAYDDGQRAELAKVAALKIALADAIRCPMGVCPDSAAGLLTVEELKDAENRRIEGKSPAIKHIGLTGDQNER